MPQTDDGRQTTDGRRTTDKVPYYKLCWQSQAELITTGLVFFFQIKATYEHLSYNFSDTSTYLTNLSYKVIWYSTHVVDIYMLFHCNNFEKLNYVRYYTNYAKNVCNSISVYNRLVKSPKTV